MAQQNPFAQIAADLRYAAGAGSSHLIASTVNEAKVIASVGAAVTKPGPGLTQIAGKRATVSQRAESSQMDPGSLAGRMTVELANGGAALAMGKRL